MILVNYKVIQSVMHLKSQSEEIWAGAARRITDLDLIVISLELLEEATVREYNST